MIIKENEGVLDRGIRLILAEILLLLSFLWFGGIVQTVLFILALVLLLTSVFGFCGLYPLLGINTCSVSAKPLSKTSLLFLGLVLVAVAGGGSYASIFFTKKFFLEDYSAMNQHYKQALFFTGQGKRDEAVSNYTHLVTSYSAFQAKYEQYHPYAISHDASFNTDLQRISQLIAAPKEKIISGDLQSAHLELEKVRPVFQDILKRNNFSMLAVYLVDFHDAMEKIIGASDTGNVDLVITTYPEVSEKLKAVEEVANDGEIQAIRMNLEQLLSFAQSNTASALSSKAAELKSSFVKVYLKRG